jgi:XrtN system VIT domain protein
MDNLKKSPLKDPIYFIGILLILLSLSVFIFPELNDIKRNESLGIFAVNYLLFLIYMFTVIINSIIKFKFKIYKNNIEYSFILLILGLIGCYSLNREMNIFSESTTWLCIYITLMALTYLLLAFKNNLPVFLKHTLYLMLGASVFLCTYLSIYLLPLYGFSALILFVLGISGHLFVPLLLIIYSAIFIKINYSADKKMIYSFCTGLLLPLLFFIYFTLQWNKVNNIISYAYNESITKNKKLPNWVYVSQQISQDWISDRVIKSGIEYSVPRNFFKTFRTPFEGNGTDGGITHDPLVMCAAYICGKPEMEFSEKIKIMEAVYDAKHKSQDRLWTGVNLQSDNVITNVEIYPDSRIAYTEKIISIKNTVPEYRWWNDTQEAIYTFHLPEGSAVTSLSLWINGKEEKGSLTTKQKAENAYKTIVGVESRDPSVIHWQEGNRVTVRVFPCTPQELRRFKIGITSPLQKTNETLTYFNIGFEGPAFNDATESFNVQFKSDPIDLKMPSFLKMKEKNYFRFDGSYYEPCWQIQMKSKPLLPQAFSFDNKSYVLETYKKEYTYFEPKNFYLDINQSWTPEEVASARMLAGTNKVFVYKDALIELNEENFDGLINTLRGLNFSLFPMNVISDPSNSLLITKCIEKSPNLHDLEESEFIKDLSLFFERKKRIPLYNLGDKLSPYLKSLKEIRLFNFDQGNLQYLSSLIKEKKFVLNAENENTVVIDNAQVKIYEQSKPVAGTGSDHIQRLYLYNDIMKKLNTNYLDKDFYNDELIKEAQIGNVVSPISSLIVLETQQDYDRFGIQKADGQTIDNKSLQNATTGSFGAVPEPHEWLLIILCVGVVSYYLIKPYLEKRFIS